MDGFDTEVTDTYKNMLKMDSFVHLFSCANYILREIKKVRSKKYEI